MELDARRKSLLWRATHRGIREMDIVMGGFARTALATMSDNEVAELEQIVRLPDHEILSWMVGSAEVPPEHRSATLSKLLAFRP